MVGARYDMLALAAEHDFANPTWNTGYVLALPTRNTGLPDGSGEARSGAGQARFGGSGDVGYRATSPEPDGSGDVLLVWKGLFSIRFSRVRPEDLPVHQMQTGYGVPQVQTGYEGLAAPLVPNGTRTPESGTERDAYSAMDIDA